MSNIVENLSIIWITRKDEREDSFIKEFFEKREYNYEYEKIIVGHTNLNPEKYKFKYIPFWDYGLDEMGLISLKKNLGVHNATKEYSLVLHADTFPTKNTFTNISNISLTDKDVIAPVGLVMAPWGEILNTRGLTWADSSNKEDIAKWNEWRLKNQLFNDLVRHKMPEESVTDGTYISGAAIFAKTNTFKDTKWNNNLGHVQGEDIEYSRRLISLGYNLTCDERIEVYMHNHT
jgi:hypothetical protein